MKRKTFLVVLSVLLAIALIGCPDAGTADPGTIGVTGIALNEEMVYLDLVVNTSSSIAATVTPANATDKTVQWVSADPTVASVDENGLITAVGEGSTNIIATTSNLQVYAILPVSVSATYIAVAGVEIIAGNDDIMSVDGTKQLYVQFSPTNASNKEISWSSSASTVATVDPYGLVTAHSAGSAVITVTSVDGSQTDTYNIVVDAGLTSVDVTGVTLTEETVTIDLSQTLQLEAEIAPLNATNQALTWASDDADVVSVNTTGLITGVAQGTANITVTTVDGTFTDTVAVTVEEKPEAVAVTGVTLSADGNVAMNPGKTLQLLAEVTPADATVKTVTWTSSNTDVATVDLSTGLVTSVAEGSVTITGTTLDGGFFDTIDITVSAPLNAAESLEAGVTALDEGDFDLALSFINDAYELDTENKAEYALWKVMALMASTVLSDEVQEVAANAGLVNFPSTMNDLVSGEFTGEMAVVDGYGGAIVIDGGEETITQTDLYYGSYPLISGYEPYLNYDLDMGGEDGPDVLNIGEYALAILNNLATDYPQGPTDILHSITAMFSATLTEVVTVLEGVDASANIAFTKEMLLPGVDASEIWPMESGEYVEFVVGEAEFLAMTGYLELINSLLTYSLSVTMDIDLMRLVDQVEYAALNDGEINDQLFFDNPMAGMMAEYEETDAVLASSKAMMSSAFGNIIEAATQLLARTQVDSPFSVSEAALGPDMWPMVSGAAEMTKEFTTRLKASLDTDATTVVVPFVPWEDATVFDQYTETVIPQGGPPEAIEFNLSVLFDRSFMDPAHVMEMDANREPVIYDFGENGSGIPPQVTTMPAYAESQYGFKMTDFTLGGFWVITEDHIQEAFNAMGVGDQVVYSDTSNDVYINAGIPSHVVWSMFNSPGDFITYDDDGDTATMKGSDSFYWAVFRDLIR